MSHGAADLRLRQVARMLGLPGEITPDIARTAIASRPGDFALALLTEAADNDDVTSAEAARAYLADRLTELGDLLDDPTRERVREAFAARLAAWGE